MAYFRHLLPVLLFICLANLASMAQKIEFEKRIPADAFPNKALEQIEQDFPYAKKLKLYQEISSDSITYEAKFCYNRARYSVEFFEDGKLMDIEKKIKYNTIPAEARKTIEQQWNQDMRRFKVVKCQEQTSTLGIRYEIEVKGKAENNMDYYEYLFEADGTFVQKSKIILRPTDMNLY